MCTLNVWGDFIVPLLVIVSDLLKGLFEIIFYSFKTSIVQKRSPFTQIALTDTILFLSQIFPISSSKWQQMTFILDSDGIQHLGTGLLTHSGECLIWTSKVTKCGTEQIILPTTKKILWVVTEHTRATALGRKIIIFILLLKYNIRA